MSGDSVSSGMRRLLFMLVLSVALCGVTWFAHHRMVLAGAGAFFVERSAAGLDSLFLSERPGGKGPDYRAFSERFRAIGVDGSLFVAREALYGRVLSLSSRAEQAGNRLEKRLSALMGTVARVSAGSGNGAAMLSAMTGVVEAAWPHPSGWPDTAAFGQSIGRLDNAVGESPGSDSVRRDAALAATAFFELAGTLRALGEARDGLFANRTTMADAVSAAVASAEGEVKSRAWFFRATRLFTLLSLVAAVVMTVVGWRRAVGALSLAEREVGLIAEDPSHRIQAAEDGSTYTEFASVFKVLNSMGDEIAARERMLWQEMDDRGRAVREAEEANRGRSAFLAAMSHEIRTPLGVVAGAVDLSIERVRDEDTPDMDDLVAARDAAGCLSALVGDVLDLSKAEAGKLVLADEAFEVAERVSAVKSMFLPAAKDKGVRLEMFVDPAIPAVRGDGGRLTQVLVNLVGNAIKFTDAGHVKVGAVPVPIPGSGRFGVSFTVEDTGCGIPEDKLETVFDEYVQAGDPARGGTGLGLAICKKLVTAMGGRIAARPTPGGGATFLFAVLFGRVDAAPVPDRRRVLVVDDNRFNRTLAGKTLERMGHVPTLAESGEEALEQVAFRDFDAIFMDISMPGMDGPETVERLRASGFDTPVFAMSADAADSGVMDGTVAKPLTRTSVETALSAVLEKNEIREKGNRAIRSPWSHDV